MAKTNFFFPFLFSFIFVAILTPLFIKVFKKLGILDDPKKRNHPGVIHTKPIPRGGGLPFLLGIILTSILFLPLIKITIAIYIAAIIALTVGILDDKYDLSPYIRFITNIVVAFIVVKSGINMSFITNPGGGILNLDIPLINLNLLNLNIDFLLSEFIAILWIVWVMNMLNWSKGIDGQMPGVVAISSFIIGLLSLRFPISQEETFIAANLSFIVSGGALGFLIFNFYPAKIFPGYGATSIYLILATVSILSGAKLATAILVMGVPMIDGIFTFVRRILTGRSPFWHDNKHLHHLLLKLGFGQRKIALSYWFFSAILGAISLNLTSKGKAFAIIMLFAIVGGFLLFLHFFLNYRDEKNNI